MYAKKPYSLGEPSLGASARAVYLRMLRDDHSDQSVEWTDDETIVYISGGQIASRMWLSS